MLFLPHQLPRELDGPFDGIPAKSLVEFCKQRWRELRQQPQIGANMFRRIRARQRAAGVNEEGRMGLIPVHTGPRGGEVAYEVKPGIFVAEKLIDIVATEGQLRGPVRFLPLERHARGKRRNHHALEVRKQRFAVDRKRVVGIRRGPVFFLRVCPKTSGGITKFSEHEAN